MTLDRETTKSRIESILNQKKAFEAVTSTIGLQVESPLNEAFYSVFHTAFIAIEHAFTGEAPIKDEVGYEGWLEWFIYENDCGDRGHDAGYDGNHKPVKTIDDILDLMEDGAKRAE